MNSEAKYAHVWRISPGKQTLEEKRIEVFEAQLPQKTESLAVNNASPFTGFNTIEGYPNGPKEVGEILSKVSIKHPTKEYVRERLSSLSNGSEYERNLLKSLKSQKSYDIYRDWLLCGVNHRSFDTGKSIQISQVIKTCEFCGKKAPVKYSCKLRICPDCRKAEQKRIIGQYKPFVVGGRVRYCKSCNHMQHTSITRCMKCGDRLKLIQLRGFKKPRLLTLNVPNFETIDAKTIRWLKSCFTKLRHRKYKPHDKYDHRSYGDLLNSGLGSLDVTNKGKGWNIHLHSLFDGSFIPFKKINPVWESITGTGKTTHLRGCTKKGGLGEVVSYLSKEPEIDNPVHLIRYQEALYRVRMTFTFGELYTRPRVLFLPPCGKCGSQSFSYETIVIEIEKPGIFTSHVPPPEVCQKRMDNVPLGIRLDEAMFCKTLCGVGSSRQLYNSFHDLTIPLEHLIGNTKSNEIPHAEPPTEDYNPQRPDKHNPVSSFFAIIRSGITNPSDIMGIMLSRGTPPSVSEHILERSLTEGRCFMPNPGRIELV